MVTIANLLLRTIRRETMDSRRFIILGGLAALFATAVAAAPTKKKAKKKAKARKVGRNFSSCRAAAAAGYRNMRVGQPGYSLNLDRDRDGRACDK